MPINVVCPGCKKRYTVSEKFAGQQGPCPNCKTILNIPRKEDEVVIHAPEDAMPKDSKGHSVIVPILREETRFSVQWALAIAGTILVAFVAALMVRFVSLDKAGKLMIGAFGAILMAPPLVWAGYTFLRDSELEPYRGKDLWIRVAACAAAYAAIWGAYAWIGWMWEVKTHFEIWQMVVIGILAVAGGAFAAFASFDLDFLVGSVHYGFYLIVTVALAYLAKLNPF
jgi:cation transport ATPase